ncbi:MAG TPA: universal stress protein [Nitrososphaera sp.]|nr:universal stress protein [Nitrososphaera sp.]
MTARILVPHDGSKWSDKAVRQAVEHAKLLKDAEIILFYVVPEVHPPPSFSYGMRLPDVKSTKEYLKELYQQMKGDAAEMLNRKKQEFTEGGVNSVRIKVSVGNPVEQILAMATAEKADLIIIGSIGRSGITRLKNLGSVSRSVSERAPCPVMIVH